MPQIVIVLLALSTLFMLSACAPTTKQQPHASAREYMDRPMGTPGPIREGAIIKGETPLTTRVLQPESQPEKGIARVLPYADYANELLRWINDHRRLYGRTPLQMDSQLVYIASFHNDWMATESLFSHGTKKHIATKQRMAGRGALCYENVGMGYPTPTPEKMFRMWEFSPGHNMNMLEANITHVGIHIKYASTRAFITMYACYWPS